MNSKSRHLLSKFFLLYFNNVIDAALVLAREVRLYSLLTITGRNLSLHVLQDIGRRLHRAPHSRIARLGPAYVHFTMTSLLCGTSMTLIVYLLSSLPSHLF
jgi:hypothetical protein